MSEKLDMPGASHSFEERGGWVTRQLAELFPLKLYQAAGFVGNLGFESGGFKTLQEIAPAVSGSRGGYGWAQWTGPRRRAFEAWCKAQGLKPSSDEANFGFAVEELRGPYRNVMRALREAATIEDAVFLVGRLYEGPGGTTETHLPGFSGRLIYAKRALDGASGAVGTPPTDPKPLPHQVVRRTRPLTRGADVEEIQRGLGIKVDGIYGPATERAVLAFQRKHNLEADGVVGEQTWTELSRQRAGR